MRYLSCFHRESTIAVVDQQVIAFLNVVTIIGNIMSQSSIPCRFDESTAAFLKAEAAREGVSQSEYIRRMVSKGLLAQSLEDAVSEIRSVSGESGHGITEEGFRFLTTSILEVRNLLRIISAKNFPTAVTEAKRDAEEEVKRLLGDGGSNVG